MSDLNVTRNIEPGEGETMDTGAVTNIRVLQPHQERVVAEKSELDIKLEALNNFRKGDFFYKLPEDEQNRLNRQAIYMDLYSGVLKERIDAFV